MIKYISWWNIRTRRTANKIQLSL